MDNDEDGVITVQPINKIQGRANGDPVIYGTYTVTYDSLGTHFEYKVDTDPNYEITSAYDFYYQTVHEVLSHSLTYTSSTASLEVELKYFSVAGTGRGYLDFSIVDGKIYVDTNF